jgi:hypothetical protein
VEIKHGGDFTEVLPFLVDKETNLKLDNGKITLQNKSGTMSIRFGSGTIITMLDESVEIEDGKVCRVVEVKARDKMNYTIGF